MSQFTEDQLAGSGDGGDGDNRTNLIINYLPQTYTDNEFYALFALVGPVASARIIRDRNSGYSFGYGFVEYENAADAAKAIKQLNKHPLQHKTIKVAYSKPSGEQTKNINLYVAGLPLDATEEEIGVVFSQYGEIVQSNILKDKSTGQGSGVAFVLYSSRAEAESAIENLNGEQVESLGKKKLTVKFARNEQKGPPKSFHKQQIYFSQLNNPLYPSMMDALYYPPAMSRGGGPMRGGRLPMRGNRRFSPMAYNTSYPLSVTGAMTGAVTGADTSGCVIFVYGIGPNTDEAMLQELFSAYGHIVCVNIVYDKEKGTGKGYGFVTFSSKDEAGYAVDCMDKSPYQGRTLQVSIKS